MIAAKDDSIAGSGQRDSLLRRVWYSTGLRSFITQLFLVIAVLLVVWGAYHNVTTHLAHRGAKTGLDFLSDPAGFSVATSWLDYGPSMSYWRLFAVGIVNTLVVSAIGIVLATIAGFLIGIARLSGNWLVSRLALVYIEIFRNTPLLLQLLFWYFAVLHALPPVRQSLNLADLVFISSRGIYFPKPTFHSTMLLLFALIVLFALVWGWWVRRWQRRTGDRLPFWWPLILSAGVIIGITWWLLPVPVQWSIPALKGFNFAGGGVVIPEFGALLFALVGYTAAFIAESVRSGILSVDKGQHEAASALGLKPSWTMRLVTIPQSMRVIIPQLTSHYMDLFKNSSLATAVGYPDLVAVFMGTTLNQTGRAIEIVVMTMLVYLVVNLIISMLMNAYNSVVAMRGGR